MRNKVNSVKIDSSKLKLHYNDVYGKGHKGMVIRGTLKTKNMDYRNSRDVAVKILKNDMDLNDVRRFIEEGLLMKDFDHPNVLSLIGVCVEKDGAPLIVLPFMKNGDLKAYIDNPNKVFSVKNLATYALHVARGMAYLSDRKCVHRDLAARNCMVDEKEVVKVSDFGLSRDLYESDYYSSLDKSVQLPVRWMAPESFRKKIYTSKSDVWAFGILLWELLTRGETPYGAVQSWDILNYLNKGNRLQKPMYAPDELYRLMQKCWEDDPNERPNFHTIVRDLEKLLQSVPMENHPSADYLTPYDQTPIFDYPDQQ
ncbi:hepatocyte growth factor receptor-like [Saccoglossus kowalevskii]